MDSCDECGFVWDEVDRAEIGSRASAGSTAIVSLLGDDPDVALTRPSPLRWSAIEYGAHVRDVLLIIRDRIVVGLVEDTPSFKPMYRDERVELGLYGDDTGVTLAAELVAAASMFGRLFDAIEPVALTRDVSYGFPMPAVRSLLWMGQQAVHEVEHHRRDIEENLGVT